MRRYRYWLAAALVTGSIAHLASAADLTPAERGRQALVTQTFTPPAWRLSAYESAWKLWGNDLKGPPARYDEAFRERYGLHPAPFDNGSLPMGLRVGSTFLGKGLTTDCLLCHGGSILGKSYIGLGNASLDIQAVFDELGRASGSSGRTPFVFSNVRGTSEAGGMAVFLLSYREPDLGVRLKPVDLDLRDDLCEDVPAWWLLKKKKTMYHTGTTPARSVRSIMQFMNSPLNSRATLEKVEPTFVDIQAFLLSLEAPKYPFPVDGDLAREGHKLFEQTCAKCHGTYGEKWTYPSRIVPIQMIGTDRTRMNGFSKKAGDYYNLSWFAKEKRPDGGEGYPVTAPVGYQAPPLDGIWATAPYLHNGSVPTLQDVLNSKARPKIFTRTYRTDADAYDAIRVGWKVEVLEPAAPSLAPYERRKIYDTSQPGRGNGGHTFGDHLSTQERRAVIEYLKTL
jgi:mono/diheme cytochrome c family protein